MLSRIQLVVMTLVTVVSGGIGALITCFILSGEYLFAFVFVGSIACLFAHEFMSERKRSEVKDSDETDEGFIFFPTDFVYNPSGGTRRCGDIHVGGDVHEEFK